VSSKDAISEFYKPQKLPPGLTLEDELALCIGYLTMSWANLESLVRGIYACVIGKPEDGFGDVVWFSINSTRARCEVLLRSTRASSLPQTFKDEICAILDSFRSVTQTRNFYAHACYKVSPETLLPIVIEGHRLTTDSDVFSTKTKKITKGTVNEILAAINRCHEINREVWPFLFHLRDITGSKRLDLPTLPLGYANNPRFPHP
jgi:hypothetical protein